MAAAARPTYANYTTGAAFAGVSGATVVQAPTTYQQAATPAEPITGQTTTVAAAQAPSVVRSTVTQYATGSPQPVTYAAPAPVQYATAGSSYLAAPTAAGTVTQYTAAPTAATAAPGPFAGVPAGMQAQMPAGAFPFNQLPGMEHLTALQQNPGLQPPPRRLTENMPTPASVEQQKLVYARALDNQLDAGKRTITEQTAQAKAILAQQAEEKKMQYAMQIEEQLMQQEMSLDQQTHAQVMQLHEAAFQQKSQLEQQASNLTLEYRQRQMQEAMEMKRYQMQLRQCDMREKMANQYKEAIGEKQQAFQSTFAGPEPEQPDRFGGQQPPPQQMPPQHSQQLPPQQPQQQHSQQQMPGGSPMGSMGPPGPMSSIGQVPQTVVDHGPSQPFAPNATLDAYGSAQFASGQYGQAQQYAPPQTTYAPQGSPTAYQSGTPTHAMGPPTGTVQAANSIQSMGLPQTNMAMQAPQTSMGLPATQMGPPSGH